LSMGATLWSFRAKVINYSTIFSLQIVWEFEVFLVFLESLEQIKFNGIYLIIFRFKVWKKLSFWWIFLYWKFKQITKTSFGRQNQLSVFTLVPTAKATLVHITGISEGAI
jgi:hypothetical protein